MSDFKLNIRVYYEDTDSGGIVYYANYLKFMERARTEYMRMLGEGYQQMVESKQLMFVVRHASIDYRKPARLDDLLQVGANITSLRRASLQFEHCIRSETGDVLCNGEIQLACIDATHYRPVSIPAAYSEVIKHDG